MTRTMSSIYTVMASIKFEATIKNEEKQQQLSLKIMTSL